MVLNYHDLIYPNFGYRDGEYYEIKLVEIIERAFYQADNYCRRT
jgi:hypothetical protein